MARAQNSRIFVFWFTLGLTAFVWLLRGIGLVTFLPGFILGFLLIASLALLIINGLIETR
ncbi:MAG: hypothetical protein B0A82_13195 [Alkalinema sp. CACIAM 70d]|uniref:hypothetical protein n=1 Tax=Alkalinema sp. FACHB-956 TaxID=2692768 RepID=UPI000B658CDB|nr:hypothetical protein [Alkalinema sp. FACHB-956]MBD2326062.1 hypothetical protein [Alkalinema sp. FACHB-956]OUC14235.1 MAG: hypothetical protein B0A82_13195 [Alkalinema sp. CACIAM 70d]